MLQAKPHTVPVVSVLQVTVLPTIDGSTFPLLPRTHLTESVVAGCCYAAILRGISPIRSLEGFLTGQPCHTRRCSHDHFPSGRSQITPIFSFNSLSLLPVDIHYTNYPYATTYDCKGKCKKANASHDNFTYLTWTSTRPPMSIGR